MLLVMNIEHAMLRIRRYIAAHVPPGPEREAWLQAWLQWLGMIIEAATASDLDAALGELLQQDTDADRIERPS
jgi:hypothetical protein